MAWTDPRSGEQHDDPRGPDWQYPTHGPEPAPPAPPPPPPPNRWRLVAIVAVVVLLAGSISFAVTSVLTDDGAASSSTPPAQVSPVPTLPPQFTLPPFPTVPNPFPTTPPTPVPTPTDPEQLILDQLVVKQEDVLSPVVVELIPEGDQVLGTVTLDVCNAEFPSEDLRRARRQVLASDAAIGEPMLSTEAVLYADDAAASQAMNEARQAAESCPPRPVIGPDGSEVTTIFNSRPDQSWPTTRSVERIAFDFDATDDIGDTRSFVSVYLQRGRALLALYFYSPSGDTLSVEGKTVISDVVKLFEERLAALPATAVNP